MSIADIQFSRIQRRVLGFEFLNGCFVAEPMNVFKPNGLLIWGAPSGAVLSQCVIGTWLEVLCSHVGVPVHFFSTCKSYEQIAKALEINLEPAAWCQWQSVHPGE